MSEPVLPSESAFAAARRSCARLLAAAVHELWPEARFGLGAATGDGFRLDVEFPRPAAEADLARMGRAGYRPVSTPAIAREALYLRSRHLPYYREDMYAPIEIDEQR